MRRKVYMAFAMVFMMGWAFVVFGADDTKQYPSCKYCGMDREKFGHSRTLINYDDGKVEAFCSIHCTAVDLAVNIDRAPKSVYVGDYLTRDLIDAEKAYWVIGGSKPGVMSARAKWAFKTEADAAAFIKQFGGTSATFEGGMKAAYEDMYQDTRAIRERRAMKRKAVMDAYRGAGHRHE